MIFFFVVDMAGPVAPMLTGGTVNQLTGSEQLGRRSELGNGHRKGPYYRKKKKTATKELVQPFSIPSYHNKSHIQLEHKLRWNQNYIAYG